jgi:hypothetical protein
MIGNKFGAGLLDRYLARTGYDSQQTDGLAAADRPANLWEPADGPAGRDFGTRAGSTPVDVAGGAGSSTGCR